MSRVSGSRFEQMWAKPGNFCWAKRVSSENQQQVEENQTVGVASHAFNEVGEMIWVATRSELRDTGTAQCDMPGKGFL